MLALHHGWEIERQSRLAQLFARLAIKGYLSTTPMQTLRWISKTFQSVFDQYFLIVRNVNFYNGKAWTTCYYYLLPPAQSI